ncbi:MAG: YlmH/Sll1252 family protein, partial [Fusobacteriaceae bacterium]
MTKENFLKNFSHEDEFLVASLYEDMELSRDIDYIVYSGYFLPPTIWKTLEKLQEHLKIGIKALGLNEFSERKILAFYPKNSQEWEFHFPVKYFKIHGENRFRELQHKDFLGTLMSLGIKREIMGDLVVHENLCYGIILEDFFQMISDEITSVATIPVKINSADESSVPQP